MTKRKTSYIGQIMKGKRYEILSLIIQGKMSGKRSIGYCQNSWMKDRYRWHNCSSTDIFKVAVFRVQVAV